MTAVFDLLQTFIKLEEKQENGFYYMTENHQEKPECIIRQVIKRKIRPDQPVKKMQWKGFQHRDIPIGENVYIKLIHGPDSVSLLNEIHVLKRLKNAALPILEPLLQELKSYYFNNVDQMGVLVTKDAGIDGYNLLIQYDKVQKTHLNCMGNAPELWLQCYNEIRMGLDYLHFLNIAHRDIKPENIAYSFATKTWRIIDFGLSIDYEYVPKKGVKDEINVNPNACCGTLPYLPPQMFSTEIYQDSINRNEFPISENGKRVDVRFVDNYSFAATMCSMMGILVSTDSRNFTVYTTNVLALRALFECLLGAPPETDAINCQMLEEKMREMATNDKKGELQAHAEDEVYRQLGQCFYFIEDETTGKPSVESGRIWTPLENLNVRTEVKNAAETVIQTVLNYCGTGVKSNLLAIQHIKNTDKLIFNSYGVTNQDKTLFPMKSSDFQAIGQ